MVHWQEDFCACPCTVLSPVHFQWSFCPSSCIFFDSMCNVHGVSTTQNGHLKHRSSLAPPKLMGRSEKGGFLLLLLEVSA